MALEFLGAAGGGAADALESLLERQLREQIVRQQREEAERRSALEQQRLGEDRAWRQSRIDREQAEDARRERADQAAQQQGLARRDIGTFVRERAKAGAMSPEELTAIDAQAYESGIAPPDLSRLTPPKPQRHAVTVPGPDGRPMRRLVGEDELEAGVPEYREPKAGPAPEQEWVVRDGEITPIPRGTARPGDVPHRQTSTGDANERMREGRLEAARGFLDRLNELRERINTKMGPEAGLTGLARRGLGNIGLDPEVAEYERIRAAAGRALAVAIMGAQNLSDADAEAWAGVLPGATVDRDTAQRLMTQIERMLDTRMGDAPRPDNDVAPRMNRTGAAPPAPSKKFTILKKGQ